LIVTSAFIDADHKLISDQKARDSHLWLGHSQNLIDLYAAQLRYDETYRREWCEKAGLGFELGELGYKSEAPIRPLLVA